jgi:CheY-like chemotaxis protein
VHKPRFAVRASRQRWSLAQVAEERAHINQNLRASALVQWHSLTLITEFALGPEGILTVPIVFVRTAGGRMSKVSLVSVVDDDQFFRESMRRLMRSLGYTVEAFASAADFLASARRVETACLIADVHMPAMTGVQLFRHLLNSGCAIPTILVTAYPDHDVRAGALKDGVVCYLRKPVDESHLRCCLDAAFQAGESPEEHS